MCKALRKHSARARVAISHALSCLLDVRIEISRFAFDRAFNGLETSARDRSVVWTSRPSPASAPTVTFLSYT